MLERLLEESSFLAVFFCKHVVMFFWIKPNYNEICGLCMNQRWNL
jgi:hypothetical protein